jgi:glycogen phosphorylase
MARLTPRFSTNRVVREYTEKHYLEAAKSFAERAANGSALANELLRWKAELSEYWPKLRFGSATVRRENGKYQFHVQAFLDDLNPDSVAVELYAEAPNGGRGDQVRMHRGEPLAGSTNAFTYGAVVSANRPASDYTPRLIPFHKEARVPLEANYILWHESPSWR